MFLTIDTEDKRPLYQQIVDAIKELIAREDLIEGAPLPSMRQMAADLGINLNTIATAYRELERDGLVAIKHGSGCVVASHSTERTQKELVRPLRAALTDLVLAGISPTKITEMVLRQLSLVARETR